MIINQKLYLSFFILIMATTSCHNSENKDNNQSFIAPSASSKGILKLNSKACYFDDVDSIQKKMDITLDMADQRELDIVENIMK